MSSIFETIINENVSIITYLVCIAFSALCGIIAAFASSFKNQSSKSFLISMVVLPIIVTTVIIMVNGNVGTGIAVAGAFSLVRFRSVAGKAREIAEIFLVMTAGLACAAGYVAISVVFTIIVSLIIILLTNVKFGSEKLMELHITVPESLNFTTAFDDLFEKYTKSARLVRTKTSNMGSLFKLNYKIELKDSCKIQDFMDELRCRNGNLEIALMENLEGTDEL